MSNRGMTFAGEPAVTIYQATVLESAIRMMKRGIKPNRAWTWANTMQAVNRITGDKFTSKRHADEALVALGKWKSANLSKADIRVHG